MRNQKWTADQPLAMSQLGRRLILHATSGAVSQTGYGLDGVTERQAITPTEIVRQVREAIGDE